MKITHVYVLDHERPWVSQPMPLLLSGNYQEFTLLDTGWLRVYERPSHGVRLYPPSSVIYVGGIEP